MQSIFKYLLTSLLAIVLLGNSLVYAAGMHDQEPAKTSNAKQLDATTLVNINKADAKELSTLKGLGAKKAAAVVAYRAEHGEFKSVDELADVKGIGKKGLARLQTHNPGKMILK